MFRRVIWAYLLLIVVVGMPQTMCAAETADRVRIERNVRIPMRDGLSLSADIIRPDGDGEYPIVIGC